MKKNVILFLILSTLNCYGQTHSENDSITQKDIKEILHFNPIQKKGVSDEDFKRGKFFLGAIQGTIEKSKKPKLYTADYWNITLALILLQEDKYKIEYFFNRGIDINSEKMCFYVHYMTKEAPETYKKYVELIPEAFFLFFENCEYKNLLEEDKVFDLENYIRNNQLESNLVKLIANIKKNDQKHRLSENTDWEQQNMLDKENQRLIDSLYNKHEKYIGKSKVGDKYEIVMWLVVQHSNIKMMEKYLPIIQNATINNEIKSDVPLKMLIDRIYSIKYNYQIFGSQGGVLIADEEVRMKVLKKYNFN